MAKDARKIPGRPSDYTLDTTAEICVRVELGETIRHITADAHMPDRATVYRWLQAQPSFRDLYARAREESAHIAADGVMEVAEEVRAGMLAPDQGRVVIDALKWSAGKRKPKVYSDKLRLTGDSENPLSIAITGLKDTLGKKLDRIAQRDAAGEPEN